MYPYPFDEPELEWMENSNGNFVGLRNDSLEVTVFRNKNGAWQIILNGSPFGRLVKNEWFDDPEDAKIRAERIYKGAPCKTMILKPQPY